MGVSGVPGFFLGVFEDSEVPLGVPGNLTGQPGHAIYVLGMVPSLQMTFEVAPVTNRVKLTAPWLKDPVWADTFEEAYWLAMKARHVSG